jgi:hypothetical protein
VPGTPQAAAAQPAAQPQILLDERFASNQRGWPHDPQSTAWTTDAGYRLFARQPGQFVAVGVPAAVPPRRDVVVLASMRKLGGPSGGGYGIIVRDEGPGPRDGRNQLGRYYVFEVGDRGEFGVWRRENAQWVDIVPWTASPAVRPGGEPNQLVVSVVGPELIFSVNATEVARHADSTLAQGAVGLFAGGDLNEVLVERLVIMAP